MSLITRFKSLLGVGSTGDKLDEEISELIQESFEVVWFENHWETPEGDNEQGEFEFVFSWKVENEVEYRLVVWSELEYDGYDIYFYKNDSEELAFETVPLGDSDEVNEELLSEKATFTSVLREDVIKTLEREFETEKSS